MKVLTVFLKEAGDQKHSYFLVGLCMFFVANSTPAQTTTKLFVTSVEVQYSNRLYDHSFHTLPTFNNPSVARVPNWVGIQVMRMAWNSLHYRFLAVANASQLLPCDVRINGNDMKMRGFMIGIPLAGDELLPLRWNDYDLLLVAGLNVGRIKLYGDQLNASNPFVAPKIMLVPRTHIGRLTISGTIEYDYDISKKAWKGTYSSDPGNFRQSGLRLGLAIGTWF